METNTIKSILSKCFTNEIYYTHVSLSGGKYSIPRQQLEEFWKAYCKEIDDQKYIYELGEKPGRELPVIGDIDLKIEVTSEDIIDTPELYDMETVKNIVGVYQDVLRETINSDELSDTDLNCVVLTKDPYTIEEGSKIVLKHGFHIHFPYIFIDRNQQDIHIIPRVKKLAKERAVFNYLNFDEHTTDKIIDSNCISVCWLLYGSKKSGSNMKPYLYKTMLDNNLDEISIEDGLTGYFIFNERQKSIDINGKIMHYLPRILSTLVFTRDMYIKTLKYNLSVLNKKPIINKKIIEKKIFNQKTFDDNMKDCEKLIDMLADFRADDRTEWMTIGWCLYSISNGEDQGFTLWDKFSQRSEKYVEGECAKLWEKMHVDDFTIGTLKFFAGLDNPQKYAEFKSEKIQKIVSEATEATHYSIAKILFEEYGNVYVCANIRENIWYNFNGIYWEESECGVTLREKISTEIIKKYRSERRKLYNKLGAGEMHDGESTDVGEDKKLNDKIKKLNLTIKMLETSGFKENIMKECKELFYNKNFVDKLDQRRDLIAFKNGVYDLSAALESPHKNGFRRGLPEDYISKCIPNNYREFTLDHEKVQKVKDIFSKIIPDKELFEYFFTINSEIFYGGNKRKICQFWIDERGNNGKTTVTTFFQNAFGDFVKECNQTMLTCKKKTSGGADADMARLGDGTRLIVFADFGEELIINDIFKRLSGNDYLWARDLFEKGKKAKRIKPMFKMVVVCNYPPTFENGNDRAVWNRAICIPFESMFVAEGYPETPEEQEKTKIFPIDTDLEEKIPSLTEAFIWYLLEWYKKQKYVKPPQKVYAAVEKYREKNDIYMQFIKDCVIESPKSTTSISELNTFIGNWIREFFPGRKVPNKADIENYFVKKWGDYDKYKRWKGYKLASLEQQLKDGEVIILEKNSGNPLI